MSRPRLLVVGFGPFPGVPRNPSGLLARRIADLPRLRQALRGPVRLLVLPTAYAAIPAALDPALAQEPDAVLMIGVARRSRRIRVEARARNRASRLFPDASATVPGRLALDPHGPAERRSPYAPRAVAILRRAGLDMRLSQDAGRYLCNACYFRVLAESRPALFVHIPPLPRCDRPGRTRPRRRRTIDAWAEALAGVALEIARPGRM